MSRNYTVLTLVYFVFALMLASGWVIKSPVAQGSGGLLMILGLLIYLFMRPNGFEVDGEGFDIVWLFHRRRIAFNDITKRELINTRDLGWMVRIGAGGVFGSFGLFKTSARGLVDGYFSVNHGLVILTLKGSRPLLISPEKAEAFMRSLGHA